MQSWNCKRELKENWAEMIFVEITSWNFSKLKEVINLQVQETHVN